MYNITICIDWNTIRTRQVFVLTYKEVEDEIEMMRIALIASLIITIAAIFSNLLRLLSDESRQFCRKKKQKISVKNEILTGGTAW